MARYALTTADRQKGFRNAVMAIQERHRIDFNQAVQWLLRKGKGLRWCTTDTNAGRE